MEILIRLLFLILAIALAGVEGTMNYLFMGMSNYDEFSVQLLQVLSIIVTAYTALGLSVISRAWKARQWLMAALASLFLVMCLAFDGLSAYGFASRQMQTSELDGVELARRRSEAERLVAQREADLQPLIDALPIEQTRQEAAVLQAQLDLIDANPAVSDPGGPCTNPVSRTAKELCPQRAAIADRLRTAKRELARSEARQRAQIDVDAAREALNNSPLPPPPDARVQLVGHHVVEGLIVAILVFGSAVCLYIAESGVRVTPQRPRPSPSPPTPLAPPAPRRKPPRSHPGAAHLAQRIRELSALSDLPGSLERADIDWIVGTQKDLARATGVSSIHKALHDAADADLIELDTHGRKTAVRSKNPS